MIDSHHHFWKYNEREFGWITPDMSVLRADFGPDQLRASCKGSEVRGVVSIQSRRSINETDALLAIAEQHDFIVGVVGWIDLADPDVAGELDRYAAHPKLVGVREVCQGAADEIYFANNTFNRGVAELRSRNLTYDILIYADQLPVAADFVDRHPDQAFVVDHCAKPQIWKDHFADSWARDIQELARRDNVLCKLSGLTTEVRDPGRTWNAALLQPYFDIVLHAFGPSRLMFGSDWPVSLLASTYDQWVDACKSLTSTLLPAEREEIFSGVASRCYKL